MLGRMGAKGEVSVIESAECPQCVVKTREAGLLIGENGRHLAAFSNILKKMAESELRRNDLESVQFIFDINDYQAKKAENLKNLARMGAQRARYFKKDVVLEPMNAYDRRIVHAALTEYPDIETESAGEEPNRKVVIKTYSITRE